ncbi:ergothioneine biosynthesis protein EgtB [Baaleninema sp.]|uniref:ergothioneine biosynthesis protein EgtB n=1 Tax=Baaleninema sp. TaxID=3101197 RepID=UPI003D039E27
MSLTGTISTNSPNSTKDILRDAFTQCRQTTLKQFAELDNAAFCCQSHPEFSPAGWHLGHIGFTEELWLLRHLAGTSPMQPQFHRLYAADGLPKTERVNLPSFEETCDYLQRIRDEVFHYLDVAPIEEQKPLWWFILQHESQHSETVALVLQQQNLSALPFSKPGSNSQLEFDSVTVPGGEFEMGNDGVEAADNERPRHRRFVEEFQIDRYPVTCGQYRQFIEAGGYDKRQYWSEAGWQWLHENGISQQLYWTNNPEFDNYPVCGVSWYEANAYAQFVGKRLPTEAEWEKAARCNPQTGESYAYPWGNDFPDASRCNHRLFNRGTTPVDAYPDGVSPVGCWDMLGNVWEWTATTFEGYSGFDFFPYPGYSQAYFDGNHYVLRGGSWATRPWALRTAFRNWYYPHIRQIFSGFRLCV